jgi:hypothetical protein
MGEGSAESSVAKTPKSETSIKHQESSISSAAEEIASDVILGQHAAAKFAGIDEKTIQRWQKRGLPFGLRDRKKTYRKSDLMLFKDSEGAANPHREREQKAKAGITEKKETLLELQINKEQRLFISREEMTKKIIAQLAVFRRMHEKFDREIMPCITPHLARPEDAPIIKAAIKTRLRQAFDRLSDGFMTQLGIDGIDIGKLLDLYRKMKKRCPTRQL